VLPGGFSSLAVPAALEFKSPRAWAFALLGLEEYLDSVSRGSSGFNCGRCAGKSFVQSIPRQQLSWVALV